MSVASRGGLVPMCTRLNRCKGIYTCFLAYEITPIVFPLETYSGHNFVGLLTLTGFSGHFWIQVAVSLPKPAVTLLRRPYRSRFGSETALPL